MRSVIMIEDPADTRIAAYRDIRERDLVGRDGQFIAEGEVVLRVMVDARHHRPLSLLIADRRVAALGALLDRVPEAVPVYAASLDILGSIAGFPMHRGILAHGQAGPMPAAEELLATTPDDARIVMLFGIANHDNMGGIFRNAAAFGADAVILDAECCDPLYRKAIRVSVGATLLVRFARLERGADPLALLERHGYTALALSPAGRTILAGIRSPGRTAILLGTEGSGLPADILARCQGVRIPMACGFDSLNVATTSGIALHQLSLPAASR